MTPLPHPAGPAGSVGRTPTAASRPRLAPGRPVPRAGRLPESPSVRTGRMATVADRTDRVGPRDEQSRDPEGGRDCTDRKNHDAVEPRSAPTDGTDRTNKATMIRVAGMAPHVGIAPSPRRQEGLACGERTKPR